MSHYVESTVRTNKLYCTDCRERIVKGESVIFDLYHGKMESVYCQKCKKPYEQEIDNDDTHPFDTEKW